MLNDVNMCDYEEKCFLYKNEILTLNETAKKYHEVIVRENNSSACKSVHLDPKHFSVYQRHCTAIVCGCIQYMKERGFIPKTIIEFEKDINLMGHDYKYDIYLEYKHKKLDIEICGTNHINREKEDTMRDRLSEKAGIQVVRFLSKGCPVIQNTKCIYTAENHMSNNDVKELIRVILNFYERFYDVNTVYKYIKSKPELDKKYFLLEEEKVELLKRTIEGSNRLFNYGIAFA